MTNNIFSTIFENYGIESVILIDTESKSNFIISNMKNDLSIERWDYLENILKDVMKKSINIIPYNQAIKCFGIKKIEEGEVIKWKMVMNS